MENDLWDICWGTLLTLRFGVEGPYGSTKQDALSYASLILNGDYRRRPWILITISEAKRKRSESELRIP